MTKAGSTIGEHMHTDPWNHPVKVASDGSIPSCTLSRSWLTVLADNTRDPWAPVLHCSIYEYESRTKALSVRCVVSCQHAAQ